MVRPKGSETEGGRIRRSSRQPVALTDVLRGLSPHVDLLDGWCVWTDRLRSDCELPARLRSLIFLRNALLLECGHNWVEHYAHARDAGLEAAKIKALRYWRSVKLFDDRERAVLRAVDEITRMRLSPATLAEMRVRLSPKEVIETVVLTSHACMVARIAQAFGAEQPKFMARQ